MGVNKYAQKLMLLSMDKAFRRDIEAIRKEFDLPLSYSAVKKDFSVVSNWNIQQLCERTKKGLPFDIFKKIDVIRETYKLPLLFRSDFITYVLMGMKALEDNVQSDDIWPKVLMEISYKNKIPEVRLRIFGDTTQEDIKKAWPAIKLIQKGQGLIPSDPLPEAKYAHVFSAEKLEEAKIILGSRKDESYETAEKIFNITDITQSRAKLPHLNVKRHRLLKKIKS